MIGHSVEIKNEYVPTNCNNSKSLTFELTIKVTLVQTSGKFAHLTKTDQKINPWHPVHNALDLRDILLRSDGAGQYKEKLTHVSTLVHGLFPRLI